MNMVLTKKLLQKEYINNKKSTYQISREVGYSNVTIGKYLKKFNISRRTNSEGLRGKHCSQKTEFKKNQPAWNFKGKIIRNGYIVIVMPNHPNRNKQNYVREHRLVVEKYLGRCLKINEKVHHRNKIKTDNSPKNLMAFISESAHQRFENGNKVYNSEIIFDGRDCNV